MNAPLHRLFATLTHGVYVIGVAGAERRNAFTAAWVMQVSFDPPLLALSINPQHLSYQLLREDEGFTVNVLDKQHVNLARHFAQPSSVDKLESITWHAAEGGAPILQDAMAWLECTQVSECPAGDHVIVVGRVVDGEILNGDATPMNYRDTDGMDGSAELYPVEWRR